ncbi:MAG: DEAD/DEAH box helicase [Capsulimonadaceae bacterium]
MPVHIHNPEANGFASPQILDYAQIHGQRNEKQTQYGVLLFEEGLAEIVSHSTQTADLVVHEYDASEKHHVRVRIIGYTAQIECDCSDTRDKPNLICAHKWAAWCTLLVRFHPRMRPAWEAALMSVFETPRKAASTTRQVLVLGLEHTGYRWAIIPYTLPAAQFGDVDVADPRAVARHVEKNHLGHTAKAMGPGSKFSTDRYTNLNASLETVVRTVQFISAANRYAYSEAQRGYGPLLHLLGQTPVLLGTGLKPLQTVLDVSNDPGWARVSIEQSQERTVLTPSGRAVTRPPGITLRPVVVRGGREFPLDEFSLVSTEPTWMQDGHALFPVQDVSPAFQKLVEQKTYTIPHADRPRFMRDYLPQLAGSAGIVSSTIAIEDVRTPPIPRLYLVEAGDTLGVELRFAYQQAELPFEKKPSPAAIHSGEVPGSLTRIHRDVDREAEVGAALSKFGLKRGERPELFQLRATTDPIDFLVHQIPRIIEAGIEIYGDEKIKSVRVNRNRPRLEFIVSSGIDWLDLDAHISFGDAHATFAELRRAVKHKERYVKLSDGTIGAIPEEWIRRYRHLFQFGVDSGESLRVEAGHVALVEDALAAADGATVDAEYERRRERLRAFEKIAPHTLPTGLCGELRPYQKAGYDWLHFLHDYEYGGILADDMGIGKTIQALTLLLSHKESGHTRSANLIVVPRSLLTNWERESNRFTPTLRVLMHSEGHRAREGEFDGNDLVLTTYGVMMRDIEILRRYRFHYAVLDESQAIKNPISLSGRAARLINAEHRLVLTGTPVENSTVELWSQFAFVNPGLLGGLEYFRNQFAGAIERSGDADSANLLRRLVFPFILRRTKDQVATDLPARTERVITAEMEPEQLALYEKTRDKYRDEILGLIGREGMQNARMRVLEALLRLRQIANHPRLMQRDYQGGSGKFELLRETLDTLRAEGHKALVFSQFVQMLTIVRESLDADGIPYAYLDGQTKNRQQRVDEFQSDPSIPFFLISLRAGGVGLNLTAADYVIHIDPWWNPAVERQATDRTHRIGQDKPVFVSRLITAGSVEEKVLLLQDRKRRLVDQLIATDESFFKSLTTDDISVLLGS